MNRAGASPRVTHLAAVIALIITATAVTPTVLTRHALAQSKTNRAKRPAKGGKAAGGSRAAAGESSRTVPVATADTYRLPPGYTGHDAVGIFTSVLAQRQFMRKSQFETSRDYEARVSERLARVPGVSSPVTILLRDIKVKYDADAGSFRIDTDPESLLYPEVFMAGEFGDQFRDYTSYYLFWNKKTLGAAVGRNAFGMRKRYVITSYTSLRMAVPSSSVSKLNRGLLLPALPAVAREMMSGLRVAVTGRLIPPYAGTDSSTDTATMTDPEESHTFIYYIYFQPEEAVVYDIRTGEVYGGLELGRPEPSQDGRRYSSVYGESPVQLEDPAERRARAEEERREREEREETRRAAEERRAAFDKLEFPPDHVFKADEVDVRAVLLSRPEPRYPNGARDASVSGTVRLRAILRASGAVEVTEVVRGLTHGLTESATEAAKLIRFTPAKRHGKAVDQEIVLEYNFNLF